jgi:abortive infection bacteriophage resistance protein
MRYKKPFLGIDQQIVLLQERGMGITDPARAADYLKRIGYYRLSAYWYPFRRSSLRPDAAGKPQAVVEDDFRPGTEFATVLALYVFDKKLRLLMLDALERIEIALRTDVSLLLGERDPWAHRNPAVLHGNFTTKRQGWNGKTAHAEWLEKLDRVASRSKDEFAQHFRRKYPGSQLPIWMAVELLDFGMLSHFIAGMTVADQEVLARRYGLPRRELLTSWVRTLNFVRNVCAHHGRLWNRVLIDQPKPPHLGEVPEFDHLAGDRFAQERFYAAAAIARFVLRIINPTSGWAGRLQTHLATFPATAALGFSGSGFPNGWQQLPLWR